MKILGVAEKPSIAKSVSNFLSNGHCQSRNGKNKYCRNFTFEYTHEGTRAQYVMTSVLGHLMSVDFEAWAKNWQQTDPEELFFAKVVKGVSKDMQSVALNLKQEARSADLLVIWTDCDREGENIGMEIANVCTSVNNRLVFKRAKFSVIQARDIRHAMENLENVDMRQALAVDARTELDLRIGAAFTRFQTLTLRSTHADLVDRIVSYGSCQFPTVGFVIDQFSKSDNFVEEPFWSVLVLHRESLGGKLTTFNWERVRIFDESIASFFLDKCKQAGLATVSNVEGKTTEKWRPLPLTTVELQKSGSRLLKISSDKMMQIAEKLYQQGFISYPRTETDQFARNFNLQPLVRNLAQHSQFKDYVGQLLDDNKFLFPRNGKNNDKAHPPIHPVRAAPSLEGDERRVFEFIARRFLGCCSHNAKGMESTVEIELAGEKFKAKGLVVLERNYLDIYVYDKWATNELPSFAVGEKFKPYQVKLHSSFTSAPRLLTEADLITLMDKNGIGTDATIQDHIRKILERQYVFKKGDTDDNRKKVEVFVPSSLGMALYEGYEAFGFQDSFYKPQLRARLESQLSDICRGAKTKDSVITEGIEMYLTLYRQVVQYRRNILTSVQRFLG